MATTPANSTNTKTTGQVSFSGTAFSGSTLTQYSALVGGASNAITSVGPGTAGQVLQSGGASANPSYSTATYPSTAGTSGNILTSNGTNWVSQAPAAVSNAFNQVVVQVFTAVGSNTYTPTTGMKYCVVELLAGGGGGGGTSNTGGVAGGGGGGGEYAMGVFSAATVGASQTVTIGDGGTGVTSAAGNTGKTTSFGALMTAIGGGGGSPNTTNNGPGNYGGTGGTGGSFHARGGSGLYGTTINGNTSGGKGGDTLWGGGGISASGGTFGGAAGTGYGSGGSGGVGNNTAGGKGAPGICVITEFLSV